MVDHLPSIREEILIRLDVPDLIRCKTVCKPWRSFISNPHFIESHLNRSHNRDRTNNEIGHRRIIMAWLPHGVTHYQCDHDCYLLGSSNGLVCLSTSDAEILVANPCTREFHMLQKFEIPDFGSSCWGFGYDSTTNVYKVVVGIRHGEEKTRFHMLASDTNVWKVIGEVSYAFISRVGMLCNGALHWLMTIPAHSKKVVIVSFRLPTEEFVEIPQPPVDCWYQSGIDIEGMSLGIMDECLCVFHHSLIPKDIWIMNNYNVKESWGKVRDDWEIKKEAVHCLSQLNKDVPYEKSLCHDVLYFRTRQCIGAPIFVQSLVSPHVCQTADRNSSHDEFRKELIKGDHPAPGTSAIV